MNADIIGHMSSGSEALAKKIPEARVVCAFNTIPSEVLFGVFEARRKPKRPSLVYCGDDARSKNVAVELTATRPSSQWTPGPFASRVTPSPSRCSSASSPTKERTAQN